ALGQNAGQVADPTLGSCITASTGYGRTIWQADTDCPAGFYSEVEYLLRWFKPVCASVPIISVGDPAAPIPGALGQPGTQVIVGGSPPHKFEFPATSGVQFTGGWLNNDGTIGFEASGFLMAQAGNSQHFDAAANGSPFS